MTEWCIRKFSRICKNMWHSRIWYSTKISSCNRVNLSQAVHQINQIIKQLMKKDSSIKKEREKLEFIIWLIRTSE